MTEADVAKLYADYGYFLFRRCHAYLGDPASAHDAVQEVFVRALGHAHAFRGESSPRTWLCRIADHLCLDVLRRRGRNPVRPEHAAFEMELAPHLRADDGDALLMARRLLEQLEPESRRLAVLYYVDELTQDELGFGTEVWSRQDGDEHMFSLWSCSKADLGDSLSFRVDLEVITNEGCKQSGFSYGHTTVTLPDNPIELPCAEVREDDGGSMP